MKKKIPKRDDKFQRYIKQIDDTWGEEVYEFTILKKYKVDFWKYQIYHTQRWLSYSIAMAYTNQHKNVHNKISRMAIKSYHLSSGLVLLPACWDKLAQLLRCFLGIKFSKENLQGRSAEEKERKLTNFQKIMDYLKKGNTCIENKIYRTLLPYWNENKEESKRRKRIYDLANEVKHKIHPEYLGIPVKDYIEIKEEELNQGRFSFGSKAIKEDVLYEHIKLLKKANNSFVKCVVKIDQIIDFEQFYKKPKNCKKIVSL
ncbi:MAG TPA: hypothetical protein PLW95_06720 [bacterium]|nr:hypothetical protein [bacterium]